MLIPEYSSQTMSPVTICSASINNKYLAVMGDEFFYQFVGKQGGIRFTDLIHPDFLSEFLSECSHLEPNTTTRLATMIKDSNEEYHLVDMSISNNNRTINNEPVLDLRIYNIISIEKRHIKFINDITKYRSFLSMYQDYLFDYDYESGNFAIYLYLGSKSTPYVQCKIEDFYNKVIKHFTKDSSKEEFETFYNKLTAAKENFSVTVDFPSLRDFSTIKRFQINGKVSYKYNSQPVVIGIMKPTGGEDGNSVAYYTTNEAKDSATGLLNKRGCMEYTNDILNLRDGQPHYMMIIDIDNFKEINDNYGHLFGDEVIQKVASVLNSTLNSRGICGRFGGDEFFIFTTKILTEEQLRNLLTSMRKKIMYAYEGILDDFRITLSIGISLYPNDGETYDSLFKKADACLYLAKNKGKNRFVIYKEELHGNLSSDSTLLHRAINPLEKAEYLACITANVSSFAVAGDISKLPELLEYIRKNFELDGIRIYSKKQRKLLYHSGSYKNMPDFEEIFANGAFLNFYNCNHILEISNTSSFEANDHEFSKSLLDYNIMSVITFYYEKEDGERLFFFYDIFNRSTRWIESDKNYLLTISLILAKML